MSLAFSRETTITVDSSSDGALLRARRTTVPEITGRKLSWDLSFTSLHV